MGVKKLNEGSLDNKKEYNFLTTEELRETRNLNQKVRNVVALGIFGTANAVIVAFIIAYFNLRYLQEFLELSSEIAETIFSYSIAAGSIGYLGTVIIGGAFSDDYRSKYGARAPYILGGSLLAGIMLLLTPIFAGTADEDLMVILFPFCFFFVYVGLGLASSPNGALLSELFNKEQRGWVGIILAGFTILGSLIGLVFFEFFTTLLIDFSSIFQLAFIAEFSLFLFPALIIIIGGILAFFLVEKANPPYPPIDSPITDILQTPRYLLNFSGSDFGKMFFVQSFWGFASEAVALYLIIHLVAAGLKEDNAPMALLVIGVVSALMAIPAGLFIQKFGKVKTAIVGSLIYSGFCFLLAGMEIGKYYNIFFIVAAIGGFGAVFIESVRASLPADLVPEGKEAQFMGINKFGSLWTQPFVALLGGFLLIALDWEYSFTAIMFVLAGLASLVATILLFFISYEKMVRDEYEKFYKRYLKARGFFEEKFDQITDSII